MTAISLWLLERINALAKTNLADVFGRTLVDRDAVQGCRSLCREYSQKPTFILGCTGTAAPVLCSMLAAFKGIGTFTKFATIGRTAATQAGLGFTKMGAQPTRFSHPLFPRHHLRNKASIP